MESLAGPPELRSEMNGTEEWNDLWLRSCWVTLEIEDAFFFERVVGNWWTSRCYVLFENSRFGMAAGRSMDKNECSWSPNGG